MCSPLKTLIQRASSALLLLSLFAVGASAWAYDWSLPAWAPRPIVPPDNPMSQAKVELGRYLFYDKRLSITGQVSCASCHQQRHGFAEPRAQALGATGAVHPRNAMSLANVAYLPRLTWANPDLHSLEAQALIPLLGTQPLEMGLAGKEATVERLLARDPRYERLFKRAFKDEAMPYTLANLTRALASFQRSLLSFDAPYDRFRYGGDANAISAAAKRGERLFFSETFKCFHCHGGVTFTDNVVHARLPAGEVAFHNTGLYADQGSFRTPSLRNVAVSAPYMHDGSVASLNDVLDHYAAGGRAALPKGGGRANPRRSELVTGFVLSEAERADFLAFFESLTDTRILTHPAHADPFR